MSRIISIAFVAAGVFVGLLLNKSIDICVHHLKDLYFDTFLYVKHSNVYTPEELAEYNGDSRPELYLAFMGTIYDVSAGSKHYGIGSPYNYFVGKDGTRAFITGNFKDDSKNKDHILDLTCDEILGLMNWKKTIKEKYKEIGFLIGRYYDREGKESDYYAQCLDRVNHCLKEKEIAKEETRKYPPCNIAWSADEGTRVWCTKSSGGVPRSWTGVPRQLYYPGSEKPRCVCVKDTTAPLIGMFKEYDNCGNTSTYCNLGQDWFEQ